MGWETSPKHNCVKPAAWLAVIAGHDVGSIWRCDSCSARWQLTRNAQGQWTYQKLSNGLAPPTIND